MYGLIQYIKEQSKQNSLIERHRSRFGKKDQCEEMEFIEIEDDGGEPSIGLEDIYRYFPYLNNIEDVPVSVYEG